MRERLQEWATYFGAAGLALWFAAGILKVLGRIQNESLIALLVVGVLLFALYVYARPAEVRQVVSSRGVRYGSNALVVVIAFVGVVGLLNFLGTRYHASWDLTANKSNSLSDQTIKVLKDLKEPVKAIAFYGPENRQPVEDELKQYAAQTDKFTYQFIDPLAQPQIAQQYKVIQPDGTIVLVRGTRNENVFGSDESGLTNGLLKVAQDTQAVIYFTTGHGEHVPDDTAQNGFSSLKPILEAVNFKVDVLNLRLITDTLPADLSALVIAGPRQPFDDQEVKRVKDYFDKNGRIFIMIDPDTQAGLDPFLLGLGLQLRNDVVIDPRFGLQGRPQIILFTNPNSHAVTQDLAGFSTIIPTARSMTKTETPPSDYTLTSLFTTSDLSWGETDLAALKAGTPVQFNQGVDNKGPLDLGYAVEGSGDKPARLIVLGNSTFDANSTLSSILSGGIQDSANVQLFINSMRWLASQENLIAIPPKATSTTQMFLTGEQSLFVTVLSSLLLPAAILILGALVWWRRR